MPTKSAPKKPSKKSPTKEEYQRFLATARKSGASKDPKDFDKAFKKIVSPKS
jgi:hypothetical protein